MKTVVSHGEYRQCYSAEFEAYASATGTRARGTLLSEGGRDEASGHTWPETRRPFDVKVNARGVFSVDIGAGGSSCLIPFRV